MGNIHLHLIRKFKKILKLKRFRFFLEKFPFFFQPVSGIILEYGRKNTEKKTETFSRQKTESFKFASQDSKRIGNSQQTDRKGIEKGRMKDGITKCQQMDSKRRANIQITDSKRMTNGQKTDRKRMIILYLSFFSQLPIRFLSFCDPILFLSCF